MKIAIGSDHAGFSLKEELKTILVQRSIEVIDVGTDTTTSVDYPDFGVAVARKVLSGTADRGILVCGSGIGMSIVANRFRGIRAALCLDTETARLSRLHNDANIIVLAGRKTDSRSAEAIVAVWLDTDFEGGRHENRLDKIEKLAASSV